MAPYTLTNAVIVLPDSLARGSVAVEGGAIVAVGDVPPLGEVIDLGGRYLAPGFVELHTHGGDGADFIRTGGSNDPYWTTSEYTLATHYLPVDGIGDTDDETIKVG